VISARISHPNERPRKPFIFLFDSRDHGELIIQVSKKVNIKMAGHPNHLCRERGQVSLVAENHFQEHRILRGEGPIGGYVELRRVIKSSRI